VFVVAIFFGLALTTGNAFAEKGEEFVFSGIQQSGGKPIFGLTDNTTGESRWLSVGQSIGGYQILSYESGTGTIMLEKDGVRISLQLADAKIKSQAAPEPAQQQKTIQVRINAKENKITVNGQLVPLDRLREVFAAQAQEMKGAPLALAVSEDASAELVTSVMNAARLAGINKFSLQAGAKSQTK
jgi:biopolymer transport protein ExbD